MDEPRSDRRHTRVDRHFALRFQKRGDPSTYEGTASNVSAGGMFLASTNSHPVGTRLEIRFIDPENGFVTEGEVVHAVDSGMGIRFLSVKELVAQLLVPEGPGAEARPADEELAAELGLYRLRFRDQAQFRQVYNRDLVSGGLFVPSRHPAALGADVQLEISVEGSALESVRLEGRVVQEAPGGMGVEISNLQSANQGLRRLGGLPA